MQKLWVPRIQLCRPHTKTLGSKSQSSKVGAVMRATQGCQTTVATNFVEGPGPGEGGMEGQGLWG